MPTSALTGPLRKSQILLFSCIWKTRLLILAPEDLSVSRKLQILICLDRIVALLWCPTVKSARGWVLLIIPLALIHQSCYSISFLSTAVWFDSCSPCLFILTLTEPYETFAGECNRVCLWFGNVAQIQALESGAALQAPARCNEQLTRDAA